jgi:outer membrane protein assembly factor BamA
MSQRSQVARIGKYLLQQVALILAMSSVCMPLCAVEAVPSNEELERSHALIGKVVIDNENIFDLTDPRENNWLFRLANRVHIKTRPNVIRTHLLFKPGDPYSRRLLDESERSLRSATYLYDASIRAVSFHDGRVDVVVRTWDVWTLNLGFNFSRSGGANSTGAQIEELNVLGTGIALHARRTSDVDRVINLYQVQDLHAFGSWTSVTATYENNSDGTMHALNVNHPFYALDNRRAWGIDAFNWTRIDSVYNQGSIVDRFHEDYRTASGNFGWSQGLQNGWARRWSIGATLDEHQFATTTLWSGITTLPHDRKLVYPWLDFSLLEDDFLKLKNRNQIERTEDFYIGTLVQARIGWSDRAWGADRNALVFSSSAARGFALEGGSMLLLAGNLSGRLEQGTLRNGLLNGSAKYYLVESPRTLFYSALQGAAGHNLDLDQQILLGGDTGLRGYPLRYQAPTGSALVTLEQRYFTDWYPFRLWRVGGAVFFDAGRTWGNAPLATPSLGLLKDFGFGLRFGNSRSGLGNITHVDLATPLKRTSGVKGIQFIVQTQQGF